MSRATSPVRTVRRQHFGGDSQVAKEAIPVALAHLNADVCVDAFAILAREADEGPVRHSSSSKVTSRESRPA